MTSQAPAFAQGTGAFPITLVVITATDLVASGNFYSQVFGWHVQQMSAELSGAMTPSGPMAALRTGVPQGGPGMIPFIACTDVEATLGRAVAAGGAVDKPAWVVLNAGQRARFSDPSGTVYGLHDSLSPRAMPRIPTPLGPGPKPPANSICSLEMYAADRAAAGTFFGDVFGWATQQVIPEFLSFDPGKSVGGVFQSHTPANSAVAYIYSDSVGATLTAIEAAGGKRMGDAMEMPGMGCFGYFADPAGTMMGLIGPSA